jgi:hypothetical protein
MERECLGAVREIEEMLHASAIKLLNSASDDCMYVSNKEKQDTN